MADGHEDRTLPSDAIAHICRFLPPNEVSCTARILNKAAAASFTAPQHKLVHVSQPIPSHALPFFAPRFGSGWTSIRKSLTYAKRLHLACLAAAGGNLATLRETLNAIGCFPNGAVIEAAAAAGHTHICEWLWELGCHRGPPQKSLYDTHREWPCPLEAAARAGKRDMCEWLLARGCTLSGKVVDAAAAGGQQQLMEWLLQQLPDYNLAQVSLVAVAEGCDLAMLRRVFNARTRQQRQLMLKQKAYIYMQDVMSAAARSRTPDWLDKVGWLKAQGWGRSAAACRGVAAAAAELPDAAERLSVLFKRGYPLTASVIEAAAGSGNVAFLRLALQLMAEEGAEPQPGRIFGQAAAAVGQLESLQVLYSAGWQFSVERCGKAAARSAYLEVVAWLVEVVGLDVRNKYHRIMADAAHSGNVELMAWLRARGCPWSGFEVNAAADSGCEAALEWLAKQPGLVDPWAAGDKPGHYIHIAVRGDLACLRALRRLRYDWDTGNCLNHCVRHGAPLPALRLLVAEECPLNRSWMPGSIQERPQDDKEQVERLILLQRNQ